MGLPTVPALLTRESPRGGVVPPRGTSNQIGCQEGKTVAHLLEEIDGGHSFIGRTDAWHRLGQILDEDITTEKIHARAPWILSPVEMRTTYVDGGLEGLRATPRTGAVVRTYDQKIVGEGLSREGYGIVQSSEAWQFAQDIVQDTMPCVSAGTIREGRQFFFTFERGDQVIAGIPMTSTVSVVGSHDGSMKVQVLFGKTVVVCANTMSWAISGAADRMLFRHTINVGDRMAEAKAVIGAFHTHDAEANKLIHRLATMDIRNFEPLLDGVLPCIEEQGRSQTMRDYARSTVRSYLESEYTDGFQNTAWAFVQAVNTYEGWNKPTRKSHNVPQSDRIAVRQFDALVKQHTPLTDKALSLVLA